MKEKEYNILVILRFENCLIKNFTKKTQWDKILAKKKRVQCVISPPHANMSGTVWELARNSLVEAFQYCAPTSQML